MEDYFQSHTFSMILTWLFSIPVILCTIGPVLAWLLACLFEKFEGIPRFLMVWLVVCFLLFSPLWYILLQILIATAYPFQSFRALLTTIVLIGYIPIVFGIMCVIGLGLPILCVYIIVYFENIASKIRLWLAALAAPIIFLIASYLFFLVLPYAAYSTHWLYTKDVIRATNGPPEYFFRYVVEPIPLMIRFPKYVKEIGFDNLSSKERLRSHVAIVYLGEKQFSFFVYKSYPEEYKRKTGYSDNLRPHVIAWAESGSYYIEANQIAFRIGIGSQPKEQDIEQMRSLLKRAVTTAQIVEPMRLNDLYPTLGDHFRNDYLPGIKCRLDALESPMRGKMKKADKLLEQWDVWYFENQIELMRRLQQIGFPFEK